MTTKQINRDNGPRTYKVTDDGGEREYPSVTSILSIISKPALYGWYAKTTAEGYTALLQANEVGDFGGLLAVERDKLPEFDSGCER